LCDRALAPIAIVFALTGLEIGIAMLQAYVFTFLFISLSCQL
jgi:hypothetical protein